MAKKSSKKEPRTKRSSRPRQSAHNCLDPLLFSVARMAGKEKKGDLAAVRKTIGKKKARTSVSMSRERGSVAVPAAVSGLPRGLQALAVQTSSYSTNRLKRSDLVQVLVMLKGTGSETTAAKVAAHIGSWQGECRTLSPTTMTARVPRNKLQDLAALNQVKIVEGSRRLKPALQLAHASAGLLDPQGEWTAEETGDGVLIGIIDTGIDASHPGFGTGAASRIIDYLDQTSGPSL